jgi:hypothetical protein
MSGARLGCPLLTARLPCGTGEIRYRCFLPDLTEFAAPSCTGPNYQQSTSHLKNNIRLRLFHLQIQSGLDHSHYTPWRRGGDSNPRYSFGVHTISSRAPSTARSPLHVIFELLRQRRPHKRAVRNYHSAFLFSTNASLQRPLISHGRWCLSIIKQNPSTLHLAFVKGEEIFHCSCCRVFRSSLSVPARTAILGRCTEWKGWFNDSKHMARKARGALAIVSE